MSNESELEVVIAQSIFAFCISKEPTKVHAIDWNDVTLRIESLYFTPQCLHH